MSYSNPPPLNNASQPSSAHPSLPARPPPSANSGPPGLPTYNHAAPSRGQITSTNFKPRTVGGQSASSGWKQAYQPSFSAAPAPPSAYSAAPGPTYPSAGAYSAAPSYAQPSQPSQPYYDQSDSYGGQSRAGGYTGAGAGRGYGGESYDPEQEAQIAQWQSAYAPSDSTVKTATGKAENANLVPLGRPVGNIDVGNVAAPTSGVAAVVSGADGNSKTVVRSGGGKTWQDSSLLEWDPSHPRIFVGNLAGEVTDDSLLKAFSRYASVQKARVIRDKRTSKSKGFGFVSFGNSDDYFQAAKEMNGKYIGSHPVLIKRSTTEIKATAPQPKGRHGKHRGGAANLNANTGAGIEKKQPKKKGGLKFLG
jgi:hypothetical protein